MKIDLKRLIFNILVPLGVGALAAFITRDGINYYSTMPRPAIAPPAPVFPVVWTILYILMGIASYRIAHAPKPTGYKNKTLILYAIQLFFNFVWPLFFFGLGARAIALLWVILLLGQIIWLCIRAWFIDRIAFWCLVPYVLWVTFATILNFAFVQMN